LPNKSIVVVHRSDGSGTTFIFSTYLAGVSTEWKNTVGTNTALDWPIGIGAKGSEGVAGNVARSSFSIGYAEYAYAKQSHLTFARLVNKNGKAVAPTADTFRAAAVSTDWGAAGKQNFYILLVDQPGDAAWPITATTYILISKQPSSAAATTEALKFFKWAFAKGGSLAIGLDYVPLPDNAVQAVETSWKQIRVSGW
jgi:phosphate transport system substrate-binding protein